MQNKREVQLNHSRCRPRITEVEPVMSFCSLDFQPSCSYVCL